jgi:hypothetical protein
MRLSRFTSRRLMRVEHTALLNEFISFWFETHVDGVLRYETFIDFQRCEWYTCTAGEAGAIVLRGELDSSMSEYEMVLDIKPKVEAAIRDVRI